MDPKEMNQTALLKLGIVPMCFEAKMKEARERKQVFTQLITELNNLKEKKVYLLHHFGMDPACLIHCLKSTGLSLPTNVEFLDMQYLCQDLVDQLSSKKIRGCSIGTMHKHIEESYYHTRKCRAKDHDSETDVVKELECYSYLMSQNKYIFSEDNFLDSLNQSLKKKQPAEGKKRKKEQSEEEQNNEERITKLLQESDISANSKTGRLTVKDLDAYIDKFSLNKMIKKSLNKSSKIKAILQLSVAANVKRHKITLDAQQSTSNFDSQQQINETNCGDQNKTTTNATTTNINGTTQNTNNNKNTKNTNNSNNQKNTKTNNTTTTNNNTKIQKNSKITKNAKKNNPGKRKRTDGDNRSLKKNKKTSKSPKNSISINNSKTTTKKNNITGKGKHTND
jgi:hypothetical protein